MSAVVSTVLRNAVLSTGALGAQLSPYFIDFYDGPVPATAEEAVDGSSTLLLTMAASTDGTTGGTWDAADNGALPKAAAETLDGLILVSGTPTFFRIRLAGDDSSALDAAKKRWQDTAGGPGNAVVFTDPAFVANSSNRKGLSVFELRFPTG